MLYLDTCVLLALLTPEVHSPAASAFLEQAPETLAISPWSATELHSALALKVRTGALSTTEADRVLEVFESSLAPGVLWLDLEADDFRNTPMPVCGAGAPACARPMPCIWRSLPEGAPRCAAWMPPWCRPPSSWGLLPC
jgi:uncharacterized protein with PIN domain